MEARWEDHHRKKERKLWGQPQNQWQKREWEQLEN